MGIAFKAKGNASFGLLLIRLTIGSMFLFAGTRKILDIEAFIIHVKSLSILPDNMAFIFGFILPFAEMLLGGLYILGFLTPLTSLCLFSMILGFILSYGGSSVSVTQFSIPEIYYYIVLTACTLMTMFAGAGSISVDFFLDRDKSKKNKNIIETVVADISVMTEENKVISPANTDDDK